MRNVRLILEYDGLNYSGWQVQKKGLTIQSIIEDAVVRITGEKSRVTGAGRTDAGVHALQQVAAFKTLSHLSTDVLKRALNANLPEDVRAIDVNEMPLNFHPRYNAKGKIYFYLISQERYCPVFLRRYSWQIPYDLNFNAMREAAAYLIGEHDFKSFQGSGCSSKTTVRKTTTIELSEHSSLEFMTVRLDVPLIKIRIEGDSFLRHMVRNIVGTLVEVGRGKLTPLRVEEIIGLRDRRLSGPTAPAQGLFLEKVIY
ncbi:MAG: tRNA pseudouridine(38-40) synthase TruA [Nitrospirae bacterium]|nr:tRNA pseudouridine(38-40) synthase TruA [Nitrospirota bacterium]